jgi:hypothetical protein
MWIAGRVDLGFPDSLPVLQESKLKTELLQNILGKSSIYLVISHHNESAGEKPLLSVRHFHIHNIKKLMVLRTILAITKFSL